MYVCVCVCVCSTCNSGSQTWHVFLAELLPTQEVLGEEYLSIQVRVQRISPVTDCDPSVALTAPWL